MKFALKHQPKWICLGILLAMTLFWSGPQAYVSSARAESDEPTRTLALAEDDEHRREHDRDEHSDEDRDGEEHGRRHRHEHDDDRHGHHEHEHDVDRFGDSRNEFEEEAWMEENWEHHVHELELHERHLGAERAELETSFGRLELIEQVFEIVASAEATAAFAVLHVKELLEFEQAEDFLLNMFRDVGNPAIKRLIRVQLAEIYAEQGRTEQVKEQLRLLILGDNAPEH